MAGPDTAVCRSIHLSVGVRATYNITYPSHRENETSSINSMSGEGLLADEQNDAPRPISPFITDTDRRPA